MSTKRGSRCCESTQLSHVQKQLRRALFRHADSLKGLLSQTLTLAGEKQRPSHNIRTFLTLSTVLASGLIGWLDGASGARRRLLEQEQQITEVRFTCCSAWLYVCSAALLGWMPCCRCIGIACRCSCSPSGRGRGDISIALPPNRWFQQSTRDYDSPCTGLRVDARSLLSG